MMKKLILSGVIACSVLSSAAMAAARDGQGFVRAELGSSNVKIEVDGESDRDQDNMYSLRGGYWFNANLAIEGFYSNIYDESVDGGSIDMRGFGVGVVAKKNFGQDGNGFFVDGRAGVAAMRTKVVVDDFGSESETKTKPYLGVGVGYDFSDNFGLSLNYDYHRIDAFDASIDAGALTLGGEYRF